MNTPAVKPKITCHICGGSFAPVDTRPFGAVRPGVSDLIAQAYPGWELGKSICRNDLSTFRSAYVESLLERERGELGALEREVVNSLKTGQLITQNLAEEDDTEASFGERMADRVASFGGSWTFIILFAVVLIGWMTLNAASLLAQPFDPYPFILLNLVLSSIAAIQAPIIMMSQRRQETKDRRRSENDYRVNLKAELEIRQLHEKMDHELAEQWDRLAEMQRIQIELLEERADDRR